MFDLYAAFSLLIYLLLVITILEPLILVILNKTYALTNQLALEISLNFNYFVTMIF
jgi:hypothetical protein